MQNSETKLHFNIDVMINRVSLEINLFKVFTTEQVSLATTGVSAFSAKKT